MKFPVLLILCLTMAVIAPVTGDVFPECENVPSDVFIALPNNCSQYIYCDGEDSFKDECPVDYLFNPENSMCDDPANVNCLAPVQSTPASTATTSATQQASSSSPVLASTTTVALSSTAPPLTLPTLTTTTLSSPATTTTPSGSGSTSPVSICPPSNSNQPESLPKPGSCSEYYLCFNGNAILMECPNNLEFNSVKRQCDWASEANCVANPTTTVSPLDQCASKLNGFFRYPDNCRYFYRCTNGMLTVQECPFGYGWDDTRKSCTPTGCGARK